MKPEKCDTIERIVVQRTLEWRDKNSKHEHKSKKADNMFENPWFEAQIIRISWATISVSTMNWDIILSTGMSSK